MKQWVSLHFFHPFWDSGWIWGVSEDSEWQCIYIHAWDDQCCLVLIGSRNQFGDSIVLSLSPLDSSENCWDMLGLLGRRHTARRLHAVEQHSCFQRPTKMDGVFATFTGHSIIPWQRWGWRRKSETADRVPRLPRPKGPRLSLWSESVSFCCET